MSSEVDFFSPALSDTGVLRRVNAPAPRTPRRAPSKLAYISRGATAGAVALSAMLWMPPVDVVGASSESAQFVRVAIPRRPVKQRSMHSEVVDHSRVQLRPRQVLAFPTVARSKRAAPRLVRIEDDGE